jgi:hypothetical protein
MLHSESLIDPRAVVNSMAKGEAGCGWLTTLYRALRERSSPAVGPLTAQVLAWFMCGAKERRPCDGLSPITEQKDAGIRTLPPASLPMAMGTTPEDTAKADPHELPSQ